ncbi:hypothetical protein MKR65_20660 [Acinetobacter baumannii]
MNNGRNNVLKPNTAKRKPGSKTNKSAAVIDTTNDAEIRITTDSFHTSETNK